MIKYHVRSRDLVTVVNEILAGRLILDAYFQRNLVWREIHKQDFIKTLLLGYPCPQIFISRGTIDVEKMETTSCVVDGQQRLDAIVSFIQNKFSVDNRKYHQFSSTEKSEFLKYELAVIELDLDNNDERIKEIFQRLNRTSNSLTAIEKLASQYAPSQYMLVASHLAGELELTSTDDGESRFRIDPEVDKSFFDWAADHPAPNFNRLYQEKNIFRSHELSRKVHLMHILNLMTTLVSGFFNRNLKTREFLDEFSENFDDKEVIVTLLERSAEIVLAMNLPEGSYWFNKANIFSLTYAIADFLRENGKIDPVALRTNLLAAEAALPDAYRLVASEGVNDLRERKARHDFLSPIVRNS